MIRKFPPVSFDVVQCKGGWDEVTPPLSLPAGYLRDCLNFECSVTGGYSRIGGFERLDGRSKPSDAGYIVVQVSSFTNTPAVGQTLTGNTSGATGVIASIGADYMILTKTSGTFTISEVVKVGATIIGTAVPQTVPFSIEQVAQNLNAAADIYRADITAVPGSGAVRGVFMLNDVRYALRNNAGGTAVDLYKETTLGWVQVAFEYEVSFSNANTSVEDGDTLSQGAVTSTIRRVMVETGTLVSGTNTGRLIISVPAGGNFAVGVATSTGGGSLTLSGAQTAITLAVGGKFVIRNYNFFGQASGIRAYGCDGVNRCWEFDGTIFAPISTGAATDTPKYIACFKDHLCVGIGSDFYNMAIGAPYDRDTAHGAFHKAIGDNITGFQIQTGSQAEGAMMIGCKNNIIMLYGTSAANWNFVVHQSGMGVSDYSIQSLTEAIFFTGQGVSTQTSSQNYGNFDQAYLTRNIKNFVKQNRTNVSCSSISRERSQYRLFFNNGYALYLTIVNGKFIGCGKIKFDKVPYCAYQGEMSDGTEVLLIGATDGYVYELDKGSSFDGNPMYETLQFNWNNGKSPRILKQWRRMSVEVSGERYADFNVGYKLGYGDADHQVAPPQHYDSNLSSQIKWDDPGITWDTPGLTWDGTSLSPTEVELSGIAENIQITFTGNLDYVYPYTINSLIFHFTPRRAIR